MSQEQKQHSEPSETTTTRSKNSNIIVIIIVVLAVVVIAWALLTGTNNEADVEVVMTAPPVVEVVPEPVITVEEEEVIPVPPRVEQIITEPAEPEVIQPRLPLLTESTAPVLASLAEQKVNTRPIRSDNVIRDFVAFVDNLAAGVVARESALINGPEARFSVEEIDGELYLNPQSYQRYNSLVAWFVGMDNQALVQVYQQFEPLFDEAYAEISRPNAPFRARLEQAVRLLQATPEQEGLIALKSDKIMYTYADHELESLASAQRQMLRLGPENMAQVKAKLAELLQALN